RFWLDRGIDGFRIDVIHCTGKDPSFADDPRCQAGQPLSDFNDQPYSHEVLRGLRKLVDSYPGDRMLVGEVNIRSTERVLQYYGAGDELHLAFNFNPLDAPWDPVLFRTCIGEVEHWLQPAGAWPTWVLSNHDNVRQRSRYQGSERASRAAAVMLLTLRGTPFIYQGEELGLEDAVITAETRTDPGGRDGCRAPIPWLAEPPHGWDGATPWLPFPPEAGELAAERQTGAANSMFALYQRLLAARKISPALHHGDFEELPSHPEVLAYRRHLGGDQRLVCINFSDQPHAHPHAGEWHVEIASDGVGEGAPYNGTLNPGRAVVLRPT
ncbi:MAG TPA: alpha-amylase, partial [Pseudomonas sp.]|nr:alpha-amylase [Pseudomonas sp.]